MPPARFEKGNRPYLFLQVRIQFPLAASLALDDAGFLLDLHLAQEGAVKGLGGGLAPCIRLVSDSAHVHKKGSLRREPL